MNALWSVTVSSLNALYLAPMALLSLVGTATMVKLALVLLRGEKNPRIRPLIDPEDA